MLIACKHRPLWHVFTLNPDLRSLMCMHKGYLGFVLASHTAIYTRLSACVVCAAACYNASRVQTLVTDTVLGSVYPGTTTLGAGVVSRMSFEMKDVWDLGMTRAL
jgi:hypothetical protein